jgi:uncharacterized protein
MIFTRQKFLALLIGCVLSLHQAYGDTTPDTLNKNSEVQREQTTATQTPGYPQIINKYINDFAKVIDDADAERIKNKLDSVEDQTGIEICVVTINSMQDYQDQKITIEQFATGLFNTWGIGKKETNNGALLLVAIKDRKLRIELGSGYSESLDSAAAKIIKSEIIPYFKHEQYSRGIYEGTMALVKKLTIEESWLDHYKWHLLVWLLIALCAGISISCFKSGKKGWGWGLLALIGVLLLFLWKLSSSKKSGGGKFGGGRSSGGGSSGSW